MDYLSFLYFLQKAYEEAKLKDVRYEGSSFVRYYNNVDLLVDAEDYFKAVCEGIQRAKSSIFICGWWISP